MCLLIHSKDFSTTTELMLMRLLLEIPQGLTWWPSDYNFTFNARGAGSIPGRGGANNPHDLWPKEKNPKP